LLVLGNCKHYTDVLLLFTSPFRVFTMKKFKEKFGLRHAHTITERLFAYLCEKRAKENNIKLPWETYTKLMRKHRQQEMNKLKERTKETE